MSQRSNKVHHHYNSSASSSYNDGQSAILNGGSPSPDHSLVRMMEEHGAMRYPALGDALPYNDLGYYIFSQIPSPVILYFKLQRFALIPIKQMPGNSPCSNAENATGSTTSQKRERSEEADPQLMQVSQCD